MSRTQSFISPPDELVPDLWQSGAVSLCRINRDCALVQVSPGFQDLVAGEKDLPLPPQLDLLIHPEDRSAFREELNRMVASGKFMDKRQVRLVTPDGRVMLMEVMGDPWPKESETAGATLVWWDRTEDEATVSWRSPEDLDTFQEAVKNFIASLNDPVVLLNTEGRIVQINPPVLDLTGYRKTELIGHPVAFLFENAPERIQKAMVRFAKLMRTGQMRDVAAQWLGKDGQTLPVTISGSVIRSNTGELIGMVMVARDERKNALLTALEKKNQELEAAMVELKRLDKMKDDVLSLVGHELRAPLANILGYAEFLNEWELSAEERREFTRIIYQESQHLRRLVNDILDLSRMEAGRMIYTYVRDSINRVVQVALDSVSADAENKKLNIELQLDDQLEPAEFDPDRIQQVVTNVIHNAIKFTEAGGRIRVITETVEGGLRVSVADEGIGIDPQHASKIFNRFEQITDVKHHSEGSGLGMAIAKQIIEEGHGGKIWFESAGKDQGAVFRFTLPEKRPGP